MRFLFSPLVSREALKFASRQDGIAKEPFDGVDTTIDNMINTAKILVGACWPQGKIGHKRCHKRRLYKVARLRR